jgi:hypothetical protein
MDSQMCGYSKIKMSICHLPLAVIAYFGALDTGNVQWATANALCATSSVPCVSTNTTVEQSQKSFTSISLALQSQKSFTGISLALSKFGSDCKSITPDAGREIKWASDLHGNRTENRTQKPISSPFVKYNVERKTVKEAEFNDCVT